ncbi:TRIO domain containing protein [Novymonas esmeraldas]|uniref:TRIO domain containing protein n=1 Tax=Novymonas esmeraldas TaxID=1808958 RepID=A0AAW0F5G0_9TRYP
MATAKPTEKEAACVSALKAKYPASAADSADAGFLNDSTYLRFARARDGDVAKATEMLGAALEWRKTTKPYAITADQVTKAMAQTAMVCGGRCNIGCPVIAMLLGMQNECTVEERTRQLVYIMEETQRKGYDRITWIVDFGAMGKHRDERTKETRKETMKIMQDYYPERMARILLYRPPWYVRLLLGVAKAFMDARTAAKIFKAGSTIEELEKFVDRDQVPAACGGTMKGSAAAHLEQLPSLKGEEAQKLGEKQHAADEDGAHDADRVTPDDAAAASRPSTAEDAAKHG